MDLAVGAKEIRVLVEHTTKDGAPRIRQQCGYPLTAAARRAPDLHRPRGHRCDPRGPLVREMVEDIDFPALQAKTEAPLHPAPDLRPLPRPGRVADPHKTRPLWHALTRPARRARWVEGLHPERGTFLRLRLFEAKVFVNSGRKIMNGLIYLIGLIVVILFILSFFGLR